MIAFDNSYARLPDRFFARQAPVPVPEPSLIVVNDKLARRLGIDLSDLSVGWLAGNGVPNGAEPIAQAYAGHQFGNFVPQLGDGRAVLLGEVVAPDGARFDLQLKGAGQTPFSRRGDGRAWLGPVLREYVVSEAMAALGVPTTRALAAVATGETVFRETSLPGGVLARVAASHIRIGTFQYFAVRGDTDGLRLLTDHVIARHHPQAGDALGLLRAVMVAQARLVAQWMALGFIHGVMNTDNMAVSGETIDYGPCAFMDVYHPQTVFSSIDRYGRYAYVNQPQIALWNLAQLASALLPLMGDEDAAVAQAEAVLAEFPAHYQGEWLRRFGAKIGLVSATEADRALIENLLSVTADDGADFTRVFRGLCDGTAEAEFDYHAPFTIWEADWKARLAHEAEGSPQKLMRATNPAIIPRNHRIEAMIAAAVTGDFAPFHRLNAALSDPFADNPEYDDLRAAPLPDEIVQATFCGT